MQKNVKDYITKNTISNIITVCIGVVLYLALSHFTIVKSALATFYNVISPFVVAFVIAFLLNTPVNWLENGIFKKMKAKRGLSVLCAYIFALIVLSALLVAVIPQVVESITSVIASVPKWLDTVAKTLNDLTTQYHWDENIVASVMEYMQTLLKTISDILLGLLPQIVNFSVSLGSVVINMVMSIIASIYMLMTKERLIFQIKKILYSLFKEKRAVRLIQIGQRSNKIFSQFINGKMIDSLIIGILCFIGTMFIYSPYALLLAVIVGVTNMIPFFGPFIGAIPSVFILLMVSPIDAIIFTVFVLVLQQFDGNILGPKILGDSTGLAPIWVLVSISIGGGLFGFAGMLIGVPTFAVIYSLISENIDKCLKSKNIKADKENMTLSLKGEEDEPLV